MNEKKKLSVIIPAYKAHNTIMQTLSSIACQSIVKDLEVLIVNDCSPEGSYKEFVDIFSNYMNIREIMLDSNSGPGVARQAGIDEAEGEFITCIDADDTFYGAFALESMLRVIESDETVVCASGTFLQLDNGLNYVPHKGDMVWMFGKIYRKSFLSKYNIRFNDTRANEDTGFNTKVRLLCSNADDSEKLVFFDVPVYLWHEKEDSITRINNCQYSFDQSFCGWTDNMIEAVQFCKKLQPFNSEVDRNIVSFLMNLYTYYIETVEKAPVFAEQNWEYVKKYYNMCYKDIEDKVTDKILADAYSEHIRNSYVTGSMLGFFPCITFKEFLNKLRTEEYNPEHIFDVWEKIPLELRQNNIDCGVCADGYYIKKDC